MEHAQKRFVVGPNWLPVHVDDMTEDQLRFTAETLAVEWQRSVPARFRPYGADASVATIVVGPHYEPCLIARMDEDQLREAIDTLIRETEELKERERRRARNDRFFADCRSKRDAVIQHLKAEEDRIEHSSRAAFARFAASRCDAADAAALDAANDAIADSRRSLFRHAALSSGEWCKIVADAEWCKIFAHHGYTPPIDPETAPGPDRAAEASSSVAPDSFGGRGAAVAHQTPGAPRDRGSEDAPGQGCGGSREMRLRSVLSRYRGLRHSGAPTGDKSDGQRAPGDRAQTVRGVGVARAGDAGWAGGLHRRWQEFRLEPYSGWIIYAVLYLAFVAACMALIHSWGPSR